MSNLQPLPKQPREPDSFSDSPSRRKSISIKKQRINEIKNKMKTIMAKVEQLQNQKKQDREELEKLMGNAQRLQQQAVDKVQKFKEMKSSAFVQLSTSVDKNLVQRRRNPHMYNTLPVPSKKFRLDQSYIRTEPLKFKKVKRQKIKFHKQTVINFTMAFICGVLLTLLIKTLAQP